MTSLAFDIEDMPVLGCPRRRPNVRCGTPHTSHSLGFCSPILDSGAISHHLSPLLPSPLIHVEVEYQRHSSEPSLDDGEVFSSI